MSLNAEVEQALIILVILYAYLFMDVSFGHPYIVRIRLASLGEKVCAELRDYHMIRIVTHFHF